MTLFFASDVDLGLSFDADELSGFATIALIVLAALIVAVLVVIFVPSVRKRITTPLRQMKDALQVFRVPGKVLHLIGGNLGSEILFATTLAIVTHAYGYELPLTTFILINTIVSLFSSVIPVPGGIGVTEAGLTWGLTAAGVPEATAFRDCRHTSIHHVLPAADLGLHVLQVADQTTLPIGARGSCCGRALGLRHNEGRRPRNACG